MEAEYEKFLQLVRAKIAIDQLLKKNVARRLNISKSLFSQYLNGDIRIPQRIQEKIIKELGIEKLLGKQQPPIELT